MFKHETNRRIGKYISDLIDRKFKSRRLFCTMYLKQRDHHEPTPEAINNMSNRLSQIIKGHKAIQTYDLPYFTELLGISCEQLLSAGENSIPLAKRLTNYAIACSDDPLLWEKYINLPEKLILNYDEYRKTILDYALEFGNYPFIKFLMDNNYIWFNDFKNEKYRYMETFGAGTSLKPRDFSSVDYALSLQLYTEDKLRTDLIALAADNNDIETLNYLRAREIPQIYHLLHYPHSQVDFKSNYNERTVKHISASSEVILDYFTDTFEINGGEIYTKDNDMRNSKNTFMFPYISELLDLLISSNSPFAETALRKAIRHNKTTYSKIREQFLAVKNDEKLSEEYYIKSGLHASWSENLWCSYCKEDLDFLENGNIIKYIPLYSSSVTKKPFGQIFTNVARTTKNPVSPILKNLAEELNESYHSIKNLKEHLEEI